MQEVYVNGNEFENAGEILEYLREELGLEAGSVNDLYDELTELSDDTKITMDMSQVADDDLLDAMERMAEVMEDAAGECDYLEVVCIE
ncbi:hypothetical protein DW049_05080 [Ruminococcus sp. AF41-9]|nr:hypothetical protein DW049_05080 [Ruminococcus sp. AF41-9]